MQKSSGETAYAELLSSIRNGVFQPGDRLREEDASERLGLSRTPVREALRRLESDGIVEHRPRLGAVIRRLDHSEVVELYEMRVMFETKAAEMAAKHGTMAEFEVLEDLNRRIAEQREAPSAAAALNQEFHQGLYLAGRNSFLLESARSLNYSLLLVGPTTLTDEARIDTVVAQHQAIIDGLREGEPVAAGEAAETHLMTSLRERLKALQA